MPRKTANEILTEAFALTDAIRPHIEQTAAAIRALAEDDVEGRAKLEAEFLQIVRKETGAEEQDIMDAVRIRTAHNTSEHDGLIAAEVHAQLG